MKKFVILSLMMFGVGLAIRYWKHSDFERAEAIPKGKPVMQYEVRLLRGEWQRWSYIHELFQTSAFIASMQVSDSLNPEFGGIIEGEDALSIVETDNTQEAIWVWCRYYEIMGDTSYFINIRRAWIYVMNHPAYLEEGTDSDYYRVWNCGLALFAESKYRGVFNDSTYLSYADTCAQYILHHPLPFNDPDPFYRRLHPKVTSLAAGMLYQYGKLMNNQVFKDTALVYGDRVKNWIEANPSVNINDEAWAMSGGTAIWGICRSIFDADTTSGINWLNTYIPYMKYYQPTGNWNNSWNIWYANAYNFSARITQNSNYVTYHHSLTDSLLVQDYDDDGGVPPTRGWTQNQDHSWVSSYVVFMGFEGLMDSIRNFDAGVNGICAVGLRPFLLVGDTAKMGIKAANYGFSPLSNVYHEIGGDYYADTIKNLAIGEEDTIWFATPWVPNDTGYFDFIAFSLYLGDQRTENDSFNASIYVCPLRLVTGVIVDSISGSGIYAKLYFQFIDDTGKVYFDSTVTDTNTGVFNIFLIDSLYRTFIQTDIPYPDSIVENIYVTPDSISPLAFYLKPADLLIVNRDNQARYANYYTRQLDSLNISYKVWVPINQGLFPINRMNEFNNNIVIWYTGKTVVNNVTPDEQESLMVFLDNGGKLLITGQNIGEEISGTQFYNNYLHAQLINDSINALKCFPDTLDSLGKYNGKLYTTGISGASNQYSRDVIASDGFSHEFLFYDSLLTSIAGVWHNDPLLHYQIIYCGFGIEAITKPILWSGYMTRKQLLAKFLTWFGILRIEEDGGCYYPKLPFTIYPNPAHEKVHIFAANFTRNKEVRIKIYETSGRLIKVLLKEKGFDKLVWDLQDLNGRHVSSGVYFVRFEVDGKDEIIKTIVLR